MAVVSFAVLVDDIMTWKITPVKMGLIYRLRINDHWQAAYGHRLYLAETFVDVSRYKGACYRAANWRHVGQTAGSSKKGNAYHYHGQPKAIYLYPLHRHFKRMLCHDPG